MTTSLAEQLKKLRTPQTSLLLEAKKKPSLLFDPTEASKLDREVVLNIGQSGLQDLIQLCGAFREFEETLFARSSMSLERSVQTSKTNELLDRGVEKFLILVSPYFLLNAAHKALEWLIHRFRIHEFNREAFLALIFPYHDTRMFVRALQLVDLKSNRWIWLKSLQKLGVPLSGLVLVKQLSTDNGMLKFLCDHVITATEVCGQDATSLSTLYGFYTMSLVGAIDRSETVTEIQMNHMLPSLAKSFGSSVPDLVASAYMILAKLVTKARLDNATTEYFVLKALKKPCLHHEAVLLVMYMYENSHTRDVPEKIVQRVAKMSWFVEQVSRIKQMGVNVSRFVVPFLETAFGIVLRSHVGTVEIRATIKDLFAKVSWNDEEIDAILVDTLRPGSLGAEVSDESKDFFSELYGALERCYPRGFDEYLKRLMKTSQTDAGSRKILKFLMSWHTGARHAKDSIDVLGKLTHYSAEQRIAALEMIGRGEVDVTEAFRDTVNEALLARFSDDDPRVVMTLLTLPIETLRSLFASETLVDELMILIAYCHTEKLARLAQPALKLLLEVCEEGDDTSVFVATLPYLFPRNDNEIGMAMQVLRSDFATKNRYMLAVSKDISYPPDAESIALAAFHNILKSELLPPMSNILSTMKFQSCRGDACSLFWNLVLLGSVCRVPVGDLSNVVAREVIEMTAEIIRQYPRMGLLPGCNQLNGETVRAALLMTCEGIVPVQVGTYVIEMVHRRLDIKSSPKIDFQNDPERAELVLRLLEILFEGMTSWPQHYSWCLKIFFQRHFATVNDMLRFLSQFFSKPVSPQSSYHCLKIALALVNRSSSVQWIFLDNTFISNLLVAMTRENHACREAAVDILKKLATTFNLSLEGYSSLVLELVDKATEISMDPEQLSFILYNLLSPDPDVTHDLPKEVRRKLQKARTMLFDTVLGDYMPIHTKSQLLEVLTHVNGPQILRDLAPFGIDLHEKLIAEKSAPPISTRFTAKAFRNVLQRYNATTVESLTDANVWELFETAMTDHEPFIPAEPLNLSPSAVMIKQIDDVFFAKIGSFSKDLQRKVLAKLIDVSTDCELSSIVAASNRAVRRIRLDARLVVEELKTMKEFDPECSVDNVTERARRSKRRSVQSLRPEVINSRRWKRGVTILEFIQRADNVDNEELLLPTLFELLRTCLGFEVQSPLEYTNQLLLSTIYHLATKSAPIPDAHLHIDLVSQCIRISHNPQTHHHALLLLVELFKVADVETALHNIMPIFTFMGSSVLRQDDAYSIQIISKTIETVLPIVNCFTDDERHACEIMRIFVVSLPDIPEHRRIPLFVKLLQLLENHLHLFYLLSFESHVLSQDKDEVGRGMSSQRLEFALTISREFEPRLMIGVCVKLVEFVKSLPIEIDDEQQRRRLDFPGKHIFDVARNSPKQLRHYKYTVVQFLSALLSGSDFVDRVAILGSEETEAMRASYDKLIVELVLIIQSASKSADLHQGKPKGKYWKVLLHNLYDILDAVNGLLPNGAFVASVRRLASHDSLTVRRKALELLNARLQQRKFNDEDRDDLLGMVDFLTEIVSQRGKMLSTETEIIQQTALITLKLLAKYLANENPAFFKPILDLTTELITTREGPMLASAVLCVAELCGSMRIHAIQSLNKFAPAIIRLLKTHCHQESPDVVVVSIVSALHKIVESVGNFLSMYLDQLLTELTRLRSLYTDTEHPKIGLVVSKLNATTQKLSSCIPLRVLLPAVSKTYDLLLASKSYQCVPPLMSILAESFSHVPPKDLQIAIPDLATFFLRVLQFREDVRIVEDNQMEVDEPNVATAMDIVNIEESASGAVVALVLKLSEATFRPLYYKLYDWAARNPEHKQRNITFYRLSANIAERLKSLFVLFAGHFLTHAASLLRANNSVVTAEPTELTMTDESNKVELVEAILLTLYRVFSYDAHNFVNQERFETLAQPIVDQIENTMGTREEFEKRATDLIVPCVAAFASATQDDSLHKQLVYQTLLKTRHTEPYVRGAALSALVEIARKLGEDFMPLLPETVPFLAELLEDEDENTEKSAQNAVRTLEDILGEPLQKYF